MHKKPRRAKTYYHHTTARFDRFLAGVELYPVDLNLTGIVEVRQEARQGYSLSINSRVEFVHLPLTVVELGCRADRATWVRRLLRPERIGL